jgi:hypothetical protein
MRHWDEIARFEREGFDIVVEKSYEDTHPRDCFDDTCYDIKELCNDIDRGKYEWFLLRVRAGVRGRWLAEEYLGACLYEDAREVLTDGTADDLIYRALKQARVEATILQGLLKSLIDARVVEAV